VTIFFLGDATCIQHHHNLSHKVCAKLFCHNLKTWLGCCMFREPYIYTIKELVEMDLILVELFHVIVTTNLHFTCIHSLCLS
jgi:hypothetical protein